jgi:hypothetical protein
VHDGCDIDAGTSLDVNQNGIPDECEVIGQLCEPGQGRRDRLPVCQPAFVPGARLQQLRHDTGGAVLHGTGIPLALAGHP